MGLSGAMGVRLRGRQRELKRSTHEKWHWRYPLRPVEAESFPVSLFCHVRLPVHMNGPPSILFRFLFHK